MHCVVTRAEDRYERRQEEERSARDNAHRYLSNLFLASIKVGSGGEKLPSYGMAPWTVRESLFNATENETQEALLQACKAALSGHADEAQRMLVAFVRLAGIEWADDRVEGVL